jgi:hypothetical protein
MRVPCSSSYLLTSPHSPSPSTHPAPTSPSTLPSPPSPAPVPQYTPTSPSQSSPSSSPHPSPLSTPSPPPLEFSQYRLTSIRKSDVPLSSLVTFTAFPSLKHSKRPRISPFSSSRLWILLTRSVVLNSEFREESVDRNILAVAVSSQVFSFREVIVLSIAASSSCEKASVESSSPH